MTRSHGGAAVVSVTVLQSRGPNSNLVDGQSSMNACKLFLKKREALVYAHTVEFA